MLRKNTKPEDSHIGHEFYQMINDPTEGQKFIEAYRRWCENPIISLERPDEFEVWQTIDFNGERVDLFLISPRFMGKENSAKIREDPRLEYLKERAKTLGFELGTPELLSAVTEQVHFSEIVRILDDIFWRTIFQIGVIVHDYWDYVSGICLEQGKIFEWKYKVRRPEFRVLADMKIIFYRIHVEKVPE